MQDQDLNIEWRPISQPIAYERDARKIPQTAIIKVRQNPKTVRGDVWLLGEHGLVCGDAVVFAWEATS